MRCSWHFADKYKARALFSSHFTMKSGQHSTSRSALWQYTSELENIPLCFCCQPTHARTRWLQSIPGEPCKRLVKWSTSRLTAKCILIDAVILVLISSKKESSSRMKRMKRIALKRWWFMVVSETYTNISSRSPLYFIPPSFFVLLSPTMEVHMQKERLPWYFLRLTIILASYNSWQYFQEEKLNSFYSPHFVYQAILSTKYHMLNTVSNYRFKLDSLQRNKKKKTADEKLPFKVKGWYQICMKLSTRK